MLRFAALACCLVIAVGATADEPKLDGVKCPISGRAVDATKSADYKGGKVYFCCGNCLAKFESDPSAMAAKANAQLAATGQAEQVACPFSGREVNADTVITVAGAKVGFCCTNCQGKAEGTEGDEQVALVFGDAAFAKGFKVAEEPKLDGVKCPISGRAVDATKSADYKGGKVYFCCGNCLAKFESDPSAMAAKANAQLAATGQAEQVACPFSGREVNADTVITVAGAKVGFCCTNCQGKAEGTEGDAQITLIFGDAAFGKGFKVKE